MLVEVVAYCLLIAFQFDVVLCRSQNQNFNGSNPYLDSYLNQYFGNNYDPNAYSTHSTTQKPLYPTLYPQPTTTPSPSFVKGHYNPSPRPYISQNSTFQIPSNTYGGNNSFYGWNSNFNRHTTAPTYQPYGQFGATSEKPPVTTLPPYYSKGSFNQYNRTSPSYPHRPNTTTSSYPTYPNHSPSYPTSSNNISSFNHVRYANNGTYPNYPSAPSYPNPYTTLPPYYSGGPLNSEYNRTISTTRPNPTNYPQYHNNRTNPTYRPPLHVTTLPSQTYPNNRPQSNSMNNYDQRNVTNYHYNNTIAPNSNWNRNTTTSNWHSTQSTNQGIKTNFSNNRYNPQYNQPSALPPMPIQPTYDQNGAPLATFTSFHSNQPIDNNLFNYDNLLGRRPANNGQSGALYEEASVPLAPFPGQNPQTHGSYDSFSNVPLAPFPGQKPPTYESMSGTPLPSYSRKEGR